MHVASLTGHFLSPPRGLGTQCPALPVPPTPKLRRQSCPSGACRLCWPDCRPPPVSDGRIAHVSFKPLCVCSLCVYPESGQDSTEALGGVDGGLGGARATGLAGQGPQPQRRARLSGLCCACWFSTQWIPVAGRRRGLCLGKE